MKIINMNNFNIFFVTVFLIKFLMDNSIKIFEIQENEDSNQILKYIHELKQVFQSNFIFLRFYIYIIDFLKYLNTFYFKIFFF